jgi:hypothetical protein
MNQRRIYGRNLSRGIGSTVSVNRDNLSREIRSTVSVNKQSIQRDSIHGQLNADNLSSPVFIPTHTYVMYGKELLR